MLFPVVKNRWLCRYFSIREPPEAIPSFPDGSANTFIVQIFPLEGEKAKRREGGVSKFLE